MSNETVIAACAVVIAIASLVVSIYQTHAIRQHNRHSVRPMLQIDQSWGVGRRAGIRLINPGLGPAIIVDSTVTIDGIEVGDWSKLGVDQILEGQSTPINVVTFTPGTVIPRDYDKFLISVASYDPETHIKFLRLANQQLTLTIFYESLYGGEHLTATHSPLP
ncbi:hypothetical protein ACIBL6_29945 [Streptomyces sp. NPDC050400]|uniref:hypothetical protein n=1 Tax=Streptomyces sp. NPDC050400 TaxID=3365610 RepID=UPI00379764D6